MDLEELSDEEIEKPEKEFRDLHGYILAVKQKKLLGAEERNRDRTKEKRNHGERQGR